MTIVKVTFTEVTDVGTSWCFKMIFETGGKTKELDLVLSKARGLTHFRTNFDKWLKGLCDCYGKHLANTETLDQWKDELEGKSFEYDV